MWWLLFFITLLLCILGFSLNRRYEHPLFIFCVTWTVVLFLFSLQVFDTITVDDRTAAILWVMILCFSIGCLSYVGIRQRRSSTRGNSQGDTRIKNVELRENLFWILSAITIIVLIRDEITIIAQLRRGSSFLDVIRVAGGAQTVEIKGSLNVFLYMFIVHPFSVCVNPICAIEFFSNKKWTYLINNLVIVALNVAHHGGRNAIIVFMLCYMLTFTLMGKKIVLSKAQKRIAIGMAGIAAILILVISKSRGIQDIWLSFYAYIICSIPLSTVYLSDTFAASGMTRGFFSFKGFFYPLNTVLNQIGLSLPHSYDEATRFGRIIEENFVSIGNYRSTGINAFLPAGTYMYVDGGFVFEVVGMLIYGSIATSLFYKAKMSMNKKNLALYVMFGYALFLSFTRLYFTSYQHVIGLLYICFLMYKNAPESGNRKKYKIRLRTY